MFRAACVIALLCGATAVKGAEPPVGDPMRPFQYVGKGGPAATGVQVFRLTAVLISPSRRIAVVNGKPCAAGDVIDGAEIASIEASAVGLKRGGKKWVIHLGAQGDMRADEGDSGS